MEGTDPPAGLTSPLWNNYINDRRRYPMNKIYEYYSTSLIKTVTVAVEICYTIGFTGSRRSIKMLVQQPPE